MEKYKIELFDDKTFKNNGTQDTAIPQVLVDAIRNALSNIQLPDDEKGWVITPVMTNPTLKEVSFGLITEQVPSVFEFVVSIKTKEYWDDIYNRLKQVRNASTGEN